MQNKSSLLAKELAKDCRTVEDIQEKLKGLFKDTIQQVFEAINISDKMCTFARLRMYIFVSSTF